MTASIPVGAPPPTISEERLVVESMRILHELSQDPSLEDGEIGAHDPWPRLAMTHFAHASHAQRILDLGSGDGHVPRAIAPSLGPDDVVVLTDLSLATLIAARSRLVRAEVPSRFRYEPVDGLRYPFRSKSFDGITAHAFVQHVPDRPALFAEIDRLLVPGGRLVLTAAPNRHFHTDRRYQRARRFHAALAEPLVALRSGRRSTEDDAGTPEGPAVERMCQNRMLLARVADELLARGLVERCPAPEQVLRWVTLETAAERVRPPESRGLDIETIRHRWLPDYDLLDFETEDHWGRDREGPEAPRGRWARALEARLARRFPQSGATFHAVLRKPEDPVAADPLLARDASGAERA